jgi:phosphoribosylanthranilate isomerase
VRTRIKICGITRLEDAEHAARLGADALGLNFCPASPRYISLETARAIVSAAPVGVETIAVVVDLPAAKIRDILEATGIAAVQLHGQEPPSTVLELAPRRVLRGFRYRNDRLREDVEEYLADCGRLGRRPVGILIDAFDSAGLGGTGRSWNWNELSLEHFSLPVFVAGGLNAHNVAAAIGSLRPYGVDVSSGVENAPGLKDPEKLRAFIDAVRTADRARDG